MSNKNQNVSQTILHILSNTFQFQRTDMHRFRDSCLSVRVCHTGRLSRMLEVRRIDERATATWRALYICYRALKRK